MKFTKGLRVVVRAIAWLVLAFVCAVSIQRFVTGRISNAENDKLRELYRQDVTDQATEQRNETEPAAAKTEDARPGGETDDTSIYESAEPVLQKDFLALYEQNNEIVGWLTAGDNIDYPVVQGDNDFYLSHGFTGESDANGTIFLNSCNVLFPRDDVLLVHGHRMVNGTMFGKLDKFLLFDYMCKYPLITFRTIYDAEDVYYTPIAAFSAPMFEESPRYFNALRTVFKDDTTPSDGVRQSKEFDEYLEDIAGRSVWKPLTDVQVGDRILALVTCSYDRENEDRRTFLICRQLRPTETPQMILEQYADSANR